MTYTPFPVWPAPEGGEGGGVTSHGALTGRSSADQHPTSAITGLDAALAVGAPEVAEVYIMATVAQVEGGFGATVTGTEITFAEAPPGVFRMLVGDSLGGMVSYTTDGTTVAPVDTDQIIGSAAKFVFAAADIFATEGVPGATPDWSVYGIDTSESPDVLRPVAGLAAAIPMEEIFGNVAEELLAVRSSWRSTAKTDDATISYDSYHGGGVYTMEAATDKTLTLDETTGGWFDGQVLRFHNIGTGTLIVEPDAAATFTAGAKTVASFSVLPGGWATVWRGGSVVGEWIVTGDNEAWLWDGVTDYLPVYGARRFVGPNDPAGEGFTLSDGDQWEDTTP